MLNHTFTLIGYEWVKNDLQMFGLKQIMGNFHPLEVVNRGSETQLQVDGCTFIYYDLAGKGLKVSPANTRHWINVVLTLVHRQRVSIFLICWFMYLLPHVNPLAAKLFNWNFHPLEVVSRWRDSQLQVSENSDLTEWRSTNFKSCWYTPRFIFNRFKS